MKEIIDWDAPDNEEGVIDFEDMEPQKEVVSVKKPTPPPSPPKKEEPVMMSEKQEKIITNATKSAQKLSKELETLDFQVDKFIKFEKRVSKFKVQNTIAIGAVALFLGGYIGSLAQGELNNYYVNQEVKHKLSGASADLELLKKARDLGVNFAIDDNRIVIYSSSQNKSVTVSKDSNHQIFEIKIGAKR